MKQREKRKFIRYDSLHLLDYQVLDEEGNPGAYSMGRTIDVSIDGLKLETTIPFKADTRLLITVGLEDDLIDLEGRTTHSHPDNGRYISGINFLKITKDGRRIFAKYVAAFQQRMQEQQREQEGDTV
jgi:PilZ domain